MPGARRGHAPSVAAVEPMSHGGVVGRSGVPTMGSRGGGTPPELVPASSAGGASTVLPPQAPLETAIESTTAASRSLRFHGCGIDAIAICHGRSAKYTPVAMLAIPTTTQSNTHVRVVGSGSDVGVAPEEA